MRSFRRTFCACVCMVNLLFSVQLGIILNLKKCQSVTVRRADCERAIVESCEQRKKSKFFVDRLSWASFYGDADEGSVLICVMKQGCTVSLTSEYRSVLLNKNLTWKTKTKQEKGIFKKGTQQGTELTWSWRKGRKSTGCRWVAEWHGGLFWSETLNFSIVDSSESLLSVLWTLLTVNVQSLMGSSESLNFYLVDSSESVAQEKSGKGEPSGVTPSARQSWSFLSPPTWSGSRLEFSPPGRDWGTTHSSARFHLDLCCTHLEGHTHFVGFHTAAFCFLFLYGCFSKYTCPYIVGACPHSFQTSLGEVPATTNGM